MIQYVSDAFYDSMICIYMNQLIISHESYELLAGRCALSDALDTPGALAWQLI